MQISFAVTTKLICIFIFATWIVQSLFYLNPKFQVSSHLLCVYSLVCVRPGWKPLRPGFSQRGSNNSCPDKVVWRHQLVSTSIPHPVATDTCVICTWFKSLKHVKVNSIRLPTALGAKYIFLAQKYRKLMLKI